MKGLNPLRSVVIWVLLLLLSVPALSLAQGDESIDKFSQEQLDQMLAPIALYPDSLLAQILMAATYPLEVVMADRWVKENRDLQGDRLNDALDNQPWDVSVKALVPFPDVLSMMNEKLNWTQMVGDAFLAQEDDVMDTVQRLRQKAYAADNLKSSDKQQVTVEDNSIQIEPANPEVVYVPAYDPTWVYGPWWWPAYPPYIVYPYWPGVVITPGYITFGVGCFVGISWGRAWGHWDWRNHHVFVNENRHININRRNIDWSHIRTAPWSHDPSHRKGVPYRNPRLQEQFRRTAPGALENRRPFRGFGEPGAAPRTPGQRSGRMPGTPGGARRPLEGKTGTPGAVTAPPTGFGFPGPGERPVVTTVTPESRGRSPERTPGSPGGGRFRDGRTGAPMAAPTPLPPAPPAPAARPSTPRTGFGFPSAGERPVATTVAPRDSGEGPERPQGAPGGFRRPSEGQTGAPAPGARPASPPRTGFGFPRN